MNHFFTNHNDGKNSVGNKLLQNGDGSLMLKKLNRLFPTMLLNQISIMVMLSVDSIVVGWGIGEKAVASVNYLRPFNFVVGILVVLISNGVATLMSKQLGVNDPNGMARKKKAILYSTLLISIVLSVLQIPICFILFRLYGMDPAVYGMSLRYAFAIMLLTPFSTMSTVGTYLLSSIGNAKTILIASLLQSGVNVVLDVIFVAGFGLSTDGAGLGTLGAGIAYWIYICSHLLTHSEFLKIDRTVECRREMIDILKFGAPSVISLLANSLFSTVFFWFISKKLSDTGIAIHSVCMFAASFATASSRSICSAMQPLTGMLSTIGDEAGMHRLLKRAMAIALSLCGGIALIVEFFPALCFRIYGYQNIPDVGITVLRVYALHFLLMGINDLLQQYFNCWDDVKFASTQGSLDFFILPAVFSSMFFLFGAPWMLWLSYGLAEVICFAISWRRYLRKYQSKRSYESPNEFNVITHPEEAPQAAAQLEHILLENGIANSLAGRIALCVEEIGAYAVPARENERVTIQLYASVSMGNATIIMLDDGQCVAFPEENQDSAPATGNYEVLRRISSECTYDYVLELNRFMVKLNHEKQEV